MPDELQITDWNLLIFNAFGDLEEQVYVPSRARPGPLFHQTRLLRDVPYTLVATANTGFQLSVHDLSDAREYRYHLAHPREYGRGLPMAAVMENVWPGDLLELRLERLVARLDLSLDLQELKAGVLLKVTEVTVGNCPSSVSLFPESETDKRFSQGFSLSHPELDALNRPGGGASLYVLENYTGDSYLEIGAEYHSDTAHTAPGERLTYHIPLGKVVRNRVYPLEVKISGEGLP